ncbi:MAG: hypothetical protein QF662_05545, partial [Phycisphaerae bacterium]|nr:hypothetical protein [Phycisphaerae bacterium]
RSSKKGTIVYFRQVRAVVDSEFCPVEFETNVTEPGLVVKVSGRRQGDEFLMKKTVNGQTTETRVKLQRGLTLRSVVRYRVFLEGLKVGRSWRWPVIDEVLGALMPDPILCQVVGQAELDKNGRKEQAHIVVIREGPQMVACFMDKKGYWPRVVHQQRNWAELLVPFGKVKDFGSPRKDLKANRVPGLIGLVYANEDLGFRFSRPPYPWAISAAPGVRMNHLTGNDWISIDVLAMLSTSVSPESLEKFMLERWATRFAQSKITYKKTVRVASTSARRVRGTALLGCSRVNFEYTFILEQGFGYAISAVAVDRPLAAIRPAINMVLSSLQLMPGKKTPGRFDGLRFTSPYYLFSLARPSKEWIVPSSRQGPRTAIEFVKRDRSACALVRIEPTGKDFPGLGPYVKRYVAQVPAKLPDAKDVTSVSGRLASAPASAVRYSSSAIDDAPCETTQWISVHEGRVYHLILITRTDKAKANEAELEAVLKSFMFLPAGDGKK